MEGDQGRLQTYPTGIYCYLVHASVEVVDEAHTCAQDLPEQGPSHYWDSRLVG
jgi:hypothetical protein